MMNFVEKVRFLSNMYDYTQIDIANGTGISKNQISKYVSGIYLPTLKNALKLSKFFDCSLDYLFGIENIPNKYNAPLGEPIFELFFERLEKLTQGKSLLSICKEFSYLHLSHFFPSIFVTFSQSILHTIYRKSPSLSFI